MMRNARVFTLVSLIAAGALVSADQRPPLRAGQSIAPDDPIALIVGRLDLERYKATIKGLAARAGLLY